MAGVRSWLRSRLRGGGAQPVNLIDRPVPMVQPPARLAINTKLNLRPWSVARLAAIFQDAAHLPTAESLIHARHARHCLSSFWLGAPVDVLEELYGGVMGELQRNLLAGPLPAQPLAADEQEWRDQLSRQLQAQFNAPERVNLLLALMAYYPPLAMRFENPLELVPEWLLRDYADHCEPALKERLQPPVRYLQAARPEPSAADRADADPSALLPLSERRGQEAMALFEQADVVNRMAALINLYGLDPADEPTRAELAGLRDTIAQLWLDVSPEQLEQLYATPVGTVTRSLIVSGFTGELVQEQDAMTRQLLAREVEDLSQPRAINHLLAALLYFPAGKVSFVGGKSFIPGWLQDELARM